MVTRQGTKHVNHITRRIMHLACIRRDDHPLLSASNNRGMREQMLRKREEDESDEGEGVRGRAATGLRAAVAFLAANTAAHGEPQAGLRGLARRAARAVRAWIVAKTGPRVISPCAPMLPRSGTAAAPSNVRIESRREERPLAPS